MLEMASLERSEPASPAGHAPTAWGITHRLVLLGVVVVLAAILAALWVQHYRPISPADVFSAERNQRRVEEMPPSQTVHLWRYLERGLEPGMSGQELAYSRALVYYRAWLGVLAVLGSIGIALIGLGIWRGRRAEELGVRSP
jgi:hypothetical protein